MYIFADTMYLLKLKIENFKNYEKAELGFSERFNCITGLNGAGKTNILDAVYYLCTGKSYFNPADQQLIYDNADYFSLKGEFVVNKQAETVLCALIKGRRKVIKRNDEPYTRLIDHYGAFPVVMIAPADLELIMGGSEERRKWLDSTISWLDSSYLHHLLKYEKILQQRNAVLRNLELENQDEAGKLLKVYNELIIPEANEIHARRKSFLEEFQPYVSDYHKIISGSNESFSMHYQSAMLDEPFDILLKNSYKKDIILQRTNVGPHRDDLEMLIENNPLKRFGSQGQQKTTLLALKLAQHQYIKAIKGVAPVLLLDDVCERLDEQRLTRLFRLIQERDKFGQIFVTDTSAQTINNYLDAGNEIRTFIVKNGTIAIDKYD